MPVFSNTRPSWRMLSFLRPLVRNGGKYGTVIAIPAVSIGAGSSLTGQELTATVLNLSGGETITYQWRAEGVDISGETASTFTPIIGTNVSEDDEVSCVATVDGVPYTSPPRNIWPQLGSFSVQPTIGGDLVIPGIVTITEGTFSIPATLSIIEFTLNSTDKTSELSGLNWDTTGEGAGEIGLQVRATDNYGRTVDSSRIIANLNEATAGVAPEVQSVVYTTGSGGNPATLDISVLYTGSEDPLEVVAVTSTSALPMTKSEILSVTGTAIEGFVFDLSVPSDVDPITSLSAASHNAPFIHFFVREKVGSGESDVEVVTVGTLDEIAPQFSSAATDNIGNEITVTFSENIWGAEDVADWVVRADTVAQTITGVSITEGTPDVVLTLSAAVSDTAVVDVSYSGGDLRDAGAEALQPVSQQPVTNNVTAGGAVSISDDANRADEVWSASPNWAYADGPDGTDAGILSNQFSSLQAGSVDAQYVYTAETPANDQYAQIDVAALDASDINNSAVLILRYTDIDNYYYVQFRQGGKTTIRSVSGGTDTQLANIGNSSADDILPGAVLRFEAQGTTLRAFVDGIERLSVTDATHAAGQIGAGLIQDSSATAAGFVALDNFLGGDL